MLLTMYDTHYGIYDHLMVRPPIKTRPLALVALHECEENGDTSTVNELITNYLDRDIGKFFGLSLTEFLDLPREYITKLLELALKKQQTETNIVNGLSDITKNMK